eukprot:gene10901-14632_t
MLCAISDIRGIVIIQLILFVATGYFQRINAQTFTYTGAYQTFVMPSGVTSIYVDITTYYIFVGQAGDLGIGNPFNGGGSPGQTISSAYNGQGGGASDIRTDTANLASRIVVAGGGGGCGHTLASLGGVGGGEIGGTATVGINTVTPAGGGTSNAGGSYGYYSTYLGSSRTLGIGGQGSTTDYGGGGGGGYYGGGGGGADCGGGGGGSSYSSGTVTTHYQGYQSGNGYVTLVLPSSAPTPMPISLPTASPTLTPISTPTINPSPTPSSFSPSQQPTQVPSYQPSSYPTNHPSSYPTDFPTLSPTASPTIIPSFQTTSFPTNTPTSRPSIYPTRVPSTYPSMQPTSYPTAIPSFQLTENPTTKPSSSPTSIPTTSPSSFPSSNPSDSPTVSPSSSPSSFPSGNPSVIPTVLPSLSPTNNSISPKPSRIPTSSPTISLGNAWTTELQSLLNDNTANYSSNTNVLSFYQINSPDTAFSSSFSKCSSWSSFLGDDLWIANSDYKVNSIEMKSVGSYVDNYPNSGMSSAFVCDEHDKAALLLGYLTEANVMNSEITCTISCSNHSWILSVCSDGIPSLCVDCEDVCNCPTGPKLVNKISKCNIPNCEYSSFSLSVISFVFDPIYQAPTINQSNLTSFSTTLNIEVTLSETASVYCASYLHDVIPDSVEEIISKNIQSNSLNGNKLVVEITGLIPSTAYDVYCAVLSQYGVSSTYQTVLSSKLTAATLCCRTVGISTVTPFILENTPYNNLIEVSLTTLPDLDLTLSLNIHLNETSTVMVHSIFPSQLSLTELSGSNKNDFTIEYNNQPFIFVISTDTPPQTPYIKSAIFSNDGGYFTIYFDSMTNMGGLNRRFKCDQLFEFKCAHTSICVWSTSAMVVAYASGSLNCISPGDSLSVTLDSSIKAQCLDITNCYSSSWDSVDANNKVFVKQPDRPISPTVAIIAPSVVGSCGGFTIDLSSSTGNGGRLWLNRSFQLSSTPTTDLSPLINHLNSNDTNLTVKIPQYLLLLGTSGEISTSGLNFEWSVNRNNIKDLSILSTSKDSSKMILLPYSLSVSKLYTITIKVTIVETLKSASTSIQVLVVPGSIIAQVAGGQYQSMREKESMIIDASSSYDEDVPLLTGVRAGLRYFWTYQQTSPIYNDTCSTALLVIPNANGTLSINSNSHSADYICVITVAAFDSTLTRSANTFVTLSILAAQYPTVSISSNLQTNGIMNPSSSLQLKGFISIPARYSGSTSWELEKSSDIALADIALSAIEHSIPLTSSLKSFTFFMVISSNALPAGQDVTFSLKCVTSGGFTSISNFIVSVNAPPSHGRFEVNPTTGVEFVDIFFFSAFYWYDENLPISYEFGLLSNVKNYVILRSKSELTYTSLKLASGLDGEDFKVLCMAQLYDSLGANSSAEQSVKVVMGSPTNSTQISNFLDNNLVVNSDEIKQLVSLATSMMNVAICSLAPNCSSLNRLACYQTENTCGKCLFDDFAGTSGDSNEPCVSIAHSNTTTARLLTTVNGIKQCSLSSQCDLFEDCIDGTCILPLKKCTLDCSGHGKCVYINSDNNEDIESCYVGMSRCTAAVCSCSWGYSGAFCSISSDELITRQSLRAKIVESIISLMEVEDPNIISIRNWITSLTEVLNNPDELSLELIEQMTQLTYRLMSLSSDFGLRFEDSYNLLNIIDTLTVASQKNIFSNSRRLSNSNITTSLNNTIGMVHNFANLVSSSLLPGQKPINASHSQFRLQVQVLGATTSGNNGSVTMPLTPLEYWEGQSPFSANIPIISSDSITIISSVLRTALYGNNKLKSNPINIRFSSSPCASSSNSSSCSLTVVLPLINTDKNFSMIDKHENVTLYCPKWSYEEYSHTCRNGFIIKHKCDGTEGSYVSVCPVRRNITICNSLNGFGEAFDVDGCHELYRTASTITCSCLMNNNNTRRILADSSGSSSVSYAAMLQSTGKTFVSTFESADNLNGATVSKGWAVLVTMGVFALAMVVALFSSSYADYSQTNSKKILPLDEDGLPVRIREKISVPIDKKRPLIQRFWRLLSSRILSKTTAPTIIKKLNPRKKYNSDIDLIEMSLPNILRSTTLTQKITEEVKHHHRWLSVIFYYSESFPRVLRVISLATNVITMLFIQSVTYNLANPDDGSCEASSACLAPRSAFATGQPKCSWTPYEDTAYGKCTFVQPNNNIKVALFVAIFSAMVSTPIALTVDALIQYVLAAPIASNKINPNHNHNLSSQSTVESKHNNSLASVVAAHRELTILTIQLREYRENLSDSQRLEFDSLWGLDRDGGFITNINGMDNNYGWSKTLRLQTFANINVHQTILVDLKSVITTVDDELSSIESSSLAKRAIGRRLLYLFQRDLLPGVSGKILESKSSRDIRKLKHSTLSAKILSWIFICILDVGMLFYITLFALQQTTERQGAWLKSFLVWFAIDLFLVSSMMVIITHVLIPSIVMKDIGQIKQRLLDTLVDYREKIKSSNNNHNDNSNNESINQSMAEAKTMDYKNRNTDLLGIEDEDKTFNAAKYLFVSYRLAKRFPNIQEARVISHFSTPWPRQSYQHVTDVSKDYSKKFSALTRSASIVLVFLIGNLLNIPPSMQDMIIHVASTVTIGYTILLHIELFDIFPVLALGPALILAIIIHFLIRSGGADAKMRLAKLIPKKHDNNNNNNENDNNDDSNNNNYNNGISHVSRRQSIQHGEVIIKELIKMDRIESLSENNDDDDDRVSLNSQLSEGSDEILNEQVANILKNLSDNDFSDDDHHSAHDKDSLDGDVISIVERN